ncbi:hypothetical protein AVEN_143546-1 [Araneus ventricosus]|uniref:Uncharacterized protein n=1 Tax=Araneus ventricosus TaxID=182803 RepID=A0A4Y2ANA8_ARAVE|nr:hypothetical protein AVEN_143546-1 [Araneus ventricosus]
MNIIENILDVLLHAVEKRSPPPRTPMDLLTALQDSWCEFPPGYLQTPVESMPRRFASLLRARGGPDTILRRKVPNIQSTNKPLRSKAAEYDKLQTRLAKPHAVGSRLYHGH